MEKLDLELLEKIADLHGIPEGSFNIRKNGERLAASSDDEVSIVQKTDKPGIDIIVAAGVKGKSVHIPVILTKGGFHDTVYNDFFIGADSDVTIVAGCGIHNPSKGEAEHDGVHTFHLAPNSRVRYIERHYGEGVKGSKRVFDPVTVVELDEGAVLEMAFPRRTQGRGEHLRHRQPLRRARPFLAGILFGCHRRKQLLRACGMRRHNPRRRAHSVHPAD